MEILSFGLMTANSGYNYYRHTNTKGMQTLYPTSPIVAYIHRNERVLEDFYLEKSRADSILPYK